MNTITQRDAAIIGVRILALYLILQLLGSFIVPAGISAALNEGADPQIIWLILGGGMLGGVLSILCWILAPRIANLIIKPDAVYTSPPVITDLQTSLFRAVGMLVLITTLPQLIAAILVFFRAPTTPWHGWVMFQTLWVPVFKSILSLALILSAQGLTYLLRKLRYGSAR